MEISHRPGLPTGRFSWMWTLCCLADGSFIWTNTADNIIIYIILYISLHRASIQSYWWFYQHSFVLQDSTHLVERHHDSVFCLNYGPTVETKPQKSHSVFPFLLQLSVHHGFTSAPSQPDLQRKGQMVRKSNFMYFLPVLGIQGAHWMQTNESSIWLEIWQKQP